MWHRGASTLGPHSNESQTEKEKRRCCLEEEVPELRGPSSPSAHLLHPINAPVDLAGLAVKGQRWHGVGRTLRGSQLAGAVVAKDVKAQVVAQNMREDI